jgi:hypothetical protein
MDRGFYGVGLPNPGVECFVAQINKLLMHYGCSSGLGIHMQVSMEMLIIEGDIFTLILAEPFSKYGKWVTHSWLRSVWEKMDMVGFWVEVTDLPLAFPCERNSWIMLAFVELDFTHDDLIGLNQARCYQNVIFKSNVFDASGRAFDRQYLKRRPAGEVWSTLLFLQEQPSAKDFQLWKSALQLVAPRGQPNQLMGGFVAKGHTIWEWCYDLEGTQHYHLKGAGMDVYIPPPGTGDARQPNWWIRADIDLPRCKAGFICTVKDIPGNEKAIICYADSPQSTPTPSTFWEVLCKWQREWMWDNLQ